MPDKRKALRGRTGDRAPPGERTAIHTIGQIGPKRKKLANGSLLCEAVPVARTGWMMYRPGEVPIKTMDGQSAAYIERGDAELFSLQTVGSLIAAVVTDEHPAADVTPQNAAHLGKGFCINAYRGEGDEKDLLLADLVITDAHLIERIDSGKREISLGYEADYFQTAPGTGRQANIIINHIALVERGRCGPRCAIGDHASSDPTFTNDRKDHSMGTKMNGPRKRVQLAEVRQQFNDTLDAIEQDEDEAGDGVHVHVHTADAGEGRASTLDAEAESRITGLEEGVAAMGESIVELTAMVRGLVEKSGTPGKTGDADPNVGGGDSKALERSFQEFVSQAEVLVPGFKVTTFDSALPRAKTVDTMCAGRRQVLSVLSATTEGAALLGSVSGDEPLDVAKAPCDQVAIAFRAAATLKGTQNNRAATGDSRSIPTALARTSAPLPSMTNADQNKANEAFWAGR